MEKEGLKIEKITETRIGFGDGKEQFITIGTDFKGNTYRLAYWDSNNLSWKLIKEFVETKTEEK